MEFFIYIYNTDEGGEQGGRAVSTRGGVSSSWYEYGSVLGTKGLTECYQFHNKVNFLLELIFHQVKKKERKNGAKRMKSPAGDNQHQTTLNAGTRSLFYFYLYNPLPPTFSSHHQNHHHFIKFPLQFLFFLTFFFCSLSIFFLFYFIFIFCAGRLPFLPPSLSHPHLAIFVSI